MATVYAVASAKGGVGKTTTTANLGALLADAGLEVVVVDADLGMANLAGTLGVDVTGPTVHDVLAGEAEPREAAHAGPAGLTVLPGDVALDAYAETDPAGIRDVIAAFDDADYVLVDGAAGLSHDSALPLALADETLLVSTPEREALIDTEKTRDLTERLGGSVAGATLTRVGPDGPVPDVSDHLHAPVLAAIPEDPAVRAAAEAGEPLVVHAPTAPATAAYRDLAAELTGETLPEREPDATDAESDVGADADAADETEAETEAEAETETETEPGDDAETDATADGDATGEADPVEADAEADAGEADADADAAEPDGDVDAAEADAEADAEAGDGDADAGDGDEDADVEAEEEDAAIEATDSDAGAGTAIPDAEGGTVDEASAEAVPFRGDDASDAEPASGEETADADEAGEEAAAEGADGDAVDDAEAPEIDEEEAEEEKKGFFSRLIGR